MLFDVQYFVHQECNITYVSPAPQKISDLTVIILHIIKKIGHKDDNIML